MVTYKDIFGVLIFALCVLLTAFCLYLFSRRVFLVIKKEHSMVSKEITATGIPVLRLNDNITGALALMTEYHIGHLAVVEDGKYLGLISESVLLSDERPTAKISDLQFTLSGPFVLSGSHPFDAVKVMMKDNLTLVPVINEDQQYEGGITATELVRFLGSQGSLDQPGGIIVLEINPVNYSLSEIARICESDSVSILNSRIYINPESGLLEVTLKTNKDDLSTLVATFGRFEYQVKEVFSDMPAYEDFMNRYHLLMNYINM